MHSCFFLIFIPVTNMKVQSVHRYFLLQINPLTLGHFSIVQPSTLTNISIYLRTAPYIKSKESKRTQFSKIERQLEASTGGQVAVS